MRYWVQFLDLSTGYVEGTIPPSFEEGHKRLIDACGSDAVFVLDGRLSYESMIEKAQYRAEVLKNVKRYPAFQIVKGPRLFHETERGRIIKVHSHENV